MSKNVQVYLLSLYQLGVIFNVLQDAELECTLAERDRELAEARAFGEEAARRYNELLSDQRILRCASCSMAWPHRLLPQSCSDTESVPSSGRPWL